MRPSGLRGQFLQVETLHSSRIGEVSPGDAWRVIGAPQQAAMVAAALAKLAAYAPFATHASRVSSVVVATCAAIAFSIVSNATRCARPVHWPGRFAGSTGRKRAYGRKSAAPSAKRGDTPKSELKGASKHMAESMIEEELGEFAHRTQRQAEHVKT